MDLEVDGEIISSTEEHPFWVPDKGWVEAGDLQVGDLLQTEDGVIIDLDGIKKREGEFEVYNFEVEDFHTYFVSDLEILVHNVCNDPRYKRPSGYRNGIREQAWENAKGPDGKVRDPLTGKEMNFDDPWDMGHKPGYEFRKHQESAEERNITRKQFLDEHNNPDHYRPELPSSNQGHAGELHTDDYYGP